MTDALKQAYAQALQADIDNAIATGDHERAARLEVVREFLLNDDFRRTLSDYTFAETYKPV